MDQSSRNPDSGAAGETLDNLLAEDRTFAPGLEFAAHANLSAEAYGRAEADPEAWWAEQARRLSWEHPFTQVLDFSDAPHATWFADGTLNVAYNCVDRHVEDGFGDKVAIYWEGEPGDSRQISYAELKDEVCKAANALLSLGLHTGDRVAIYLPMIPEAVFSMLACARLGLAHSVIFGGFSAEALRTRIADADARLIITADGQYRRGSAVSLKAAVDEAVATPGSPIEHVLVVNRTGIDISWGEKDLWWHELVDRQSTDHVPEAFPAEQPLFILYTSGTTGKPKGILHTSGGYLTQAAFTHHAVFDHKPDTDVFWCTADIGWVTGHSYIVYGPLANRATEVIYEGTPNTPHEGRHWEIVDKYGVTIYYTAPTLIRTFMKWGADIPARPWVVARAGLGGRADQSRSVDVVPDQHRPRALPHRRHVVADRDRRHDDLTAARGHGDQARVRDGTAARHSRAGRQRRGKGGRDGPGRLPRHRQAVAGDAADDLG